MMIVNLVGFSVGLDGMRTYLTTAFWSAESLGFVAGTLATFFSAAQIMFAVRAREARHAVHRDY
jgi:D-alanyl-lipoteichoic acid acyltransferase DltB (MBOAT superfamily)